MATSKIFLTLLIVAMAAVFGAGCSDDNPVTPNTIDTAPPAVPVNLSAGYDDSGAIITWAENTVDTDLVGYVVSRENKGVTEMLIDTPTMITSFTDPLPKAGVSTYHVSAVDRAGNQSAVASVTLTLHKGSRDYDLHR